MTMFDTAVEAARAAGRILLEGCRGEIEVDKVIHRDIKLAMDRKAEEAILGIVRGRFPEHAILSEEAGSIESDSEYLWVIDPLDGTVNYSRRIPMWGTSVGLMRNGEELLGVVYDPIHDELFSAEKGKGAFLNGKPIRVNAHRDFGSAAVAFGFAAEEELFRRGHEAVTRISARVGKVRDLGTAVLHLAYVASGRLEGFCELGLNHWDFAAGTVIVSEAGGRVDKQALPGRPNAFAYLCSNGLIHDELRRLAAYD
jgi:myo-inositol-1(or 4)-monophosphatase